MSQRYRDQPYYVHGWIDPYYWVEKDCPSSMEDAWEHAIFYWEKGDIRRFLWWLEIVPIADKWHS